MAESSLPAAAGFLPARLFSKEGRYEGKEEDMIFWSDVGAVVCWVLAAAVAVVAIIYFAGSQWVRGSSCLILSASLVISGCVFWD